MALDPNQLQMTPGEAAGGAQGVSAYNTRVAALQKTTDAGTTTGKTDAPSQFQEVLKALQAKVMGQSGVVTSDSTNIDKTIQDAIQGVQGANNSSRAGITAEYAREKADVVSQAEKQLISTQEEAKNLGPASNMAILNMSRESTAKALKDLDLREQQALATGDVKAAETVANLKLERLKFQQDTEQKAFSNMLALSGLELNSEQLAQQKEQAAFDQTIQKFDFLSKNNLLGNSDSDSKRNLEAQLGLPTGILDKVKKGDPLNLQKVDGVGLVNVVTDANGKTHADVLMHSVDKTTTSPEDTLIGKFGAALADPTKLAKAGTREQFIRQLIAQFPQIDESSIASYVYNTYPDNYVNSNGSSHAIDYYVQKIKDGSMDISAVPADVRTDVANKL